MTSSAASESAVPPAPPRYTFRSVRTRWAANKELQWYGDREPIYRLPPTRGKAQARASGAALVDVEQVRDQPVHNFLHEDRAVGRAQDFVPLVGQHEIARRCAAVP